MIERSVIYNVLGNPLGGERSDGSIRLSGFTFRSECGLGRICATRSKPVQVFEQPAPVWPEELGLTQILTRAPAPAPHQGGRTAALG